MEIETDALQLLFAEESRLYGGGLNPDNCCVTCQVSNACADLTG